MHMIGVDENGLFVTKDIVHVNDSTLFNLEFEEDDIVDDFDDDYEDEQEEKVISEIRDGFLDKDVFIIIIIVFKPIIIPCKHGFDCSCSGRSPRFWATSRLSSFLRVGLP